jgi:hypothetical protein
VCLKSGLAADLSTRLSGVDCLSAGPGKFLAGSSHCKTACYYSQPLPCLASDTCSEAVCCGTGCVTPGCKDAVWPGLTGKAAFCADSSPLDHPDVTGILCCKD